MRAHITLEIEDIDPDDFQELVKMIQLGYVSAIESYDASISGYELIAES